MAKEIASVEIQSSHGGIFIRFLDGSCRTLGIGHRGTLINYSNDGITYKENGKTKYYNLKTDSVTILD